MGVARTVSDARTGRDFLQRHGDNGRREVSVGLAFKALKSPRRLENARSVNALLAPAMAARGEDPFAAIPELAGFALFAADGHSHGAAVHDPVGTTGAGQPVKRATGHFFLLNLRDHHLSHLALAQSGGARKAEHDMHALKRSDFAALRGGTPAGTKVILVWDCPSMLATRGQASRQGAARAPGGGRASTSPSGRRRRAPPASTSSPARKRT